MCPDVVVARLSIGMHGVVTPGSPNRLRSEPTTASSHNILDVINAGEEFAVVGGPTCADGYRWWQVEFRGLIGWTAEGDDQDYYVAPTGN